MAVLLIKGLIKPEIVSRKRNVCFKCRHERTEKNNAHSYQAISPKLKNMFFVAHRGPIGESFGGK